MRLCAVLRISSHVDVYVITRPPSLLYLIKRYNITVARSPQVQPGASCIGNRSSQRPRSRVLTQHTLVDRVHVPSNPGPSPGPRDLGSGKMSPPEMSSNGAAAAVASPAKAAAATGNGVAASNGALTKPVQVCARSTAQHSAFARSALPPGPARPDCAAHTRQTNHAAACAQQRHMRRTAAGSGAPCMSALSCPHADSPSLHPPSTPPQILLPPSTAASRRPSSTRSSTSSARRRCCA